MLGSLKSLLWMPKGGLQTFKSRLSAFALIFLVVLWGLTDGGQEAEENWGLSWLFLQRGKVTAPANVVIVTVDKLSAEILHLPEDPEKWPRIYYAQLLDRINRQHPSVIGFNIFFGENRDVLRDKDFADHISAQNNVILSNRLKKLNIPAGFQGLLSYEGTENPIDILNAAAFQTAPFPIAKTDTTVKAFWTFRRSAGDIATLPMTVFNYYVFQTAYVDILHLLQKTEFKGLKPLPISFVQLLQDSDAADLLSNLLQQFSQNQRLRSSLQEVINTSNSIVPATKILLKAWLEALEQTDRLQLNYYGPSGTITRVPFYQALMIDTLKPDFFQNKIVLVGYSETLEPEMNQGFYTVYSKAGGQTVSNIEIAATAVANLVDHTWFLPLSPIAQLLLTLFWGLLLLFIYWHYQDRRAYWAIASMSLLYLCLAYGCFVYWQCWLPIFIPLVLICPLVLLIMTIGQHFSSRADQLNIHRAMRLYLPDRVVQNLANHTDVAAMDNVGELMFGVCMASDAGQYTALSENLSPQALHQLMNQYYAVLFAQITKHQGVISDVIGDAAMALWVKPVTDVQVKIQACQSALAIQSATSAFNDVQAHALPTRIGLHFGEMRLGNVGAADHYEYRAIGDCINTAARIENLNKLLGTQILVSAEVIQQDCDFFFRELGVFMLKGKRKPTPIFELVAAKADMTDDLWTLARLFAEALALFNLGEWDRAFEAFEHIYICYPADGPTRFYRHYLLQNMASSMSESRSEQNAWIDSERAYEGLLRS